MCEVARKTFNPVSCRSHRAICSVCLADVCALSKVKLSACDQILDPVVALNARHAVCALGSLNGVYGGRLCPVWVYRVTLNVVGVYDGVHDRVKKISTDASFSSRHVHPCACVSAPSCCRP